MLDKKTLNDFVSKANWAYREFCFWKYSNNLFTKYQNKFDGNSCNYKLFWYVITTSLQHSWILSIARLIDPAYSNNDKNKPNLSISYILELLDNERFKREIKKELERHKEFTNSIKKLRNKFLAHNDINFLVDKIKAGVEIFFQTLDDIIEKIINKEKHLKNCDKINLKYREESAQRSIKAIFDKII